MITKIGIAAGEIWYLLEKESKLPLSTLLSRAKKDMAEDEDMIYMGLGWLIREGHIILEKKKADYITRLKKPSPE